MADETVAGEEIAEPMESTKAQGYVEPDEPSREARVAALVKHVAHAMLHNSPIGNQAFAELKALLGVE